MSGYVKTFKMRDGDEDKNNNLMSFLYRWWEDITKIETAWTKIEGLKNIELNALLVYDDRSIKSN